MQRKRPIKICGERSVKIFISYHPVMESWNSTA